MELLKACDENARVTRNNWRLSYKGTWKLKSETLRHLSCTLRRSKNIGFRDCFFILLYSWRRFAFIRRNLRNSYWKHQKLSAGDGWRPAHHQCNKVIRLQTACFWTRRSWLFWDRPHGKNDLFFLLFKTWSWKCLAKRPAGPNNGINISIFLTRLLYRQMRRRGHNNPCVFLIILRWTSRKSRLKEAKLPVWRHWRQPWSQRNSPVN